MDKEKNANAFAGWKNMAAYTTELTISLGLREKGEKKKTSNKTRLKSIS